MKKELLSKTLVAGIVVLFISMSIFSSAEKIDIITSRITIYDGTLSGYVNNTSGNPIEGALVRVHFHETYEEDYSDSDGYYQVTNIPICYCLKNVTCSKDCYKTEWVLLGIVEDTTYDFILTPYNNPPGAPTIRGFRCSVPPRSIKSYEKNTVNDPPKPRKFSFNAVDPDGNNVRYLIDWHDGDGETTDFYPSGIDVIVYHTYTAEGTYKVTARAQDTCGLVGPEGSIPIPMMQSRKMINPIFLLILGQFFDVFPILQKILLLQR